ncbi:carboxypeptidase regulatory-like domain-containing protein [Microbacterium sp. P07]|uniref:carboxypeptidase regulatory-like domain-containing protein n=1 Tax=Microbacterium sp. P07 TaxID=3366952 RepID=UPI003744EB83
MHQRDGARQPRSLRKAAALLVSAVVAGSFFSPTGVAVATAAEPGTGRILGRLASETGEPVAGDVVAIDESTGQAYSATAQSNGAYAITGVPAGRYAVLFRPSEAAMPGAPYGYVDAWYPNARRGDGAARVIVDVGTETLAVDSALCAAGRVTGVLAGIPGTYAVALLDEPTPVDPFDGDTLVAELDAAGEFALRAPAGGYELLVYRRSGHDWHPYAVAETRVEVESRSPVGIPVIAAPAAGAAELVLRDDDGGLAVEADVILRNTGSSRVERDGLTDDAGRVVFEGLASGTYTVAVNGVERTPSLVVAVHPDLRAHVTEPA